jgi:hypothetical protein
MKRIVSQIAAGLLVLADGAAARPAYLVPERDPELGTTIVRIAGDAGTAIPGTKGTWGRDARHVYSKQAPWNADGSLLLLQNRDGGSPARLLLDGRTYAPRALACGDDILWDYRWHPRRAQVLVNVDKAGRELSLFDVAACRKVASWTLPVEVDGIGSGEGNLSDDGRYVALADDDVVFVVDLSAPSGAAKTGPLFDLKPCKGCGIGNVSISPSGRYVDVKFKGKDEETKDLHRILEVDAATLALAPHAMSPRATRCGSFAGRTDGWIFPLKHADMARDPFDHDEDVIIGGRSCAGSKLGRVVKVRLKDGRVTALTDPAHEASVAHVSTRNRDRPGWAYVSYFRAEGKRFSDEIVAVKLDGSRTVERIARTHGTSKGCYRCEAHPAPSPDGRRVVFASNWGQDGGDADDIKAYVVETAQRTTTNLPARSPSAESTRHR